MKLFIIIAIIYLVIALIVFGVQALFSGDSDQSFTDWGIILKNSIGWFPILLMIIFRR